MKIFKKPEILFLDNSLLSKKDMSKTEKISILGKIQKADFVIFNISLSEQNDNLSLFIRLSNLMNIQNFGVISLPLSLEGRLKVTFSMKKLAKLNRTLDDIIVINSDEIVDNLQEKITFENAKIIISEVRNRNANIIKYYYENNLDISDIGKCLQFNIKKLSTIY